MNQVSGAALPARTVEEAILHSLATRYPESTPWTLAASTDVKYMPWSTLYFLTVASTSAEKRLVVKIVHFPDQQTPEVSWQSEELLIRGRREFDSLVKVYTHFSQPPHPYLRALRPDIYLPEINAIVMDFADGVPLYDHTIKGLRLLAPQGRQSAHDMMTRCGQWLRWLHTLPLGETPAERVQTPGFSLAALITAMHTLQGFGVDLEQLPQWPLVIERLQRVQADQQVWYHGDFHMRNMFVLPDHSVMGIDTALERVDSPYYDVGKFVVDLKTRRTRILTLGLFPSSGLVDSLIRAFFRGYFDGAAPMPGPLALYEGRFLLEKWGESLETLHGKFSGSRAPLGAALRVLVVNPTFMRLVRRWMATIKRHL